MIVLLGWVGLASCTPIKAAGAPPTLKIGLVAPFEGLHRPLGYEALFGVKLALQERNQNGGLNGYKVELVALNDFDDAGEAEIQAKALVTDPEVLGVVGHLSDAATQAALPIYQQAQLAVTIPWSWAPAAATLDDGFSGVVNVAATATESSGRLAEFIRAAGFDDAISLDGDNLNSISPSTEAIVLETDGVTGGEIMLALKQAGVPAQLFGQTDVGSSQLVQVAKEAANGLIYVSPGPNPDELEAQKFIEAYQALAGFRPGPRAVLAYDAANVLLDSIEQAMTSRPAAPSRTQVSTAISQVRRDGLSGKITFDGQGRRLQAPVWVYQISNRQYPGTRLSP